jgi:DegV family protein with EDD domain
MSMKQFLAMSEETWPQTAGPSTETFAQAFREVVEAGDQAVCIAVTSKLSTTHASAVLAGRQFSSDQVIVLDSMSFSVGQGLLIRAAAQAAQEGKNLEEVVGIVKELQTRLHLYVALDTVKYLIKGGRANRLTGMLVWLLRIRPILTTVGGELTLLDRPRGRQAAKQRLLELALSHFPAEAVAVTHIVCEDEAQELASEISRRSGFPEDEILLVETGMALATHGGPGTLGIAVVSK